MLCPSLCLEAFVNDHARTNQHTSVNRHGFVKLKRFTAHCANKVQRQPKACASHEQGDLQVLLCESGGVAAICRKPLVPGAGIEPARLAAGDFESPASTNFTTRARERRP